MNSYSLNRTLFEKSKEELDKLHEECMRKNFLSPLARKKRKLIAELNYLLKELTEQIEHHKNTDNPHLNSIIEEFSQLTFKLKDINKQN